MNLHAYADFTSWLTPNTAWCSGRVWLPAVSSTTLVTSVPQKQRFFDISPVATLKGFKNPTEAAGMRLANLVDSLALCDFLAWLEDVAERGGMDPSAVPPCDVEGLEPPKSMTEASVMAYLDRIRQAADGCLGLSFSTIPGAGATIRAFLLIL